MGQMLLGGGQNALEPDNDQIVQQVSMNALGSATHVILLEATDPLADRGFNLSLRLHGDLERAAIRIGLSGGAMSCRRHRSHCRAGNRDSMIPNARLLFKAGCASWGAV